MNRKPTKRVTRPIQVSKPQIQDKKEIKMASANKQAYNHFVLPGLG